MKKSHLLVYMILMLLATTIVYSNHFGNAFQFDDSHTVTDNTYIRDVSNIPLFFKDGTTLTTLPANQAYRPLVVTSLAIDYWLGGGYNLFYFHLSTFIVFLLQGVLMFFLFKIILNTTGNKKMGVYTALLAATWYLLHPAIAETVNYVSARSDVQSTFFVVIGFVLFAVSPFCRRYFLYLLPVCIGGFSKPTVVMFAPMLFFYILFFEERISLFECFKKRYRSQTIAAIKKSLPAFIICGLLYAFITRMTPETWVPGGSSVYNYLITQPFVILHYFSSFFAPTQLSADTDWKLLEGVGDARFFIGSMFILLMLIIAFQASKKTMLRPISFGITWFFLALVPTSSIVPLGEVLNDHRMYFPFIGLALSVTWTIALLLHALMPVMKRSMGSFKPIMIICIVLALSIYAYGTHERNKVWKTPESLWKDVTIKSPDNPRGLMNYGLTLMERGDYDGAIGYYQKTISMWPTYAYGYINIGIAKEMQGKTAEAEDNFKRSLALGEKIPEVYFFYAQFLMNNGRNSEAAPLIDKGLSLSPHHANLLSLLDQNATILSNVKNTSSTAIDQLLETIKTAPTPENYLTLSLEYYNTAQYEKCIDAAREALKLKPEYDLAYNNICAAYNRLKNWDKAIEAGEKGLAINPNNTLLSNNLAESRSGKANAK